MDDWLSSDDDVIPECPKLNQPFNGASRGRGRGNRRGNSNLNGSSFNEETNGGDFQNEFGRRNNHDNSMWGASNNANAQGRNGGGFRNNRNDRNDRGGPRTCHNCGGIGHISAQCPSEPGLSSMTQGMSISDRGNGGSRSGLRSGPMSGSGRPTGGSDYVPPTLSVDQIRSESAITAGTNFRKHQEREVEVTGSGSIPQRCRKFSDFQLRSQLTGNIKHSEPLPIQQQAIPIIKAGRDLMACAYTGSGKTLAFVLPILHKLLEEGIETVPNRDFASPEAVVIAPTRELVLQIQKEFFVHSNKTPIKVCVAYGGTSVRQQRDHIRSGANVLVATTGRLMQFMDEGVVNFDSLRFLVLDEADRMLDDRGFANDLDRIIRHPSMKSKAERQTLMFSATFPSEIKQAASNFLKPDHLFIKVGTVGAANDDIIQEVRKVERFQKREELETILKDLKDKNEKVLVFVETKKTTDFLGVILNEMDDMISSTTIHGDREQREREMALDDFKRGNRMVLIGTEVAARGLDIPKVSVVINYDMPKEIDQYVHRIGRTGRVGNEGRSITFYDPKQDFGMAKNLVEKLAESKQVVPDWLQKEAELNRNSGAANSGFGGYSTKDTRKSSKNDFFSAPAPVEDDELWD